MSASRVARRARLQPAFLAAQVVLTIVGGCTSSIAPSATPFSGVPSSPPQSLASSSTAPSERPSASAPELGTIVILGRIVTMAEPSVAEALLIEDGTVVAVASRDEVLSLVGDGVPVIDIGRNVAYPGFIDAHAHWIGDREHFGIATAAAAI